MVDWKPIPDHTGYEVSSDGRVRFLGGPRKFGHQTRYAPPCERRPQPHSGGYLQLRLNGRNVYIHRLVAEAFVPRIAGFDDVNHINGNKTDNRVENLEWCDRSVNVLHASRVLNKGKHSRAGRRLTAEEVAEIANDAGAVKEIAARYKVSTARIYRIRRMP